MGGHTLQPRVRVQIRNGNAVDMQGVDARHTQAAGRLVSQPSVKQSRALLQKASPKVAQRP